MAPITASSQAQTRSWRRLVVDIMALRRALSRSWRADWRAWDLIRSRAARSRVAEPWATLRRFPETGRGALPG